MMLTCRVENLSRLAFLARRIAFSHAPASQADLAWAYSSPAVPVPGAGNTGEAMFDPGSGVVSGGTDGSMGRLPVT